MKKIISIILFGCLSMGCIIGDETHVFSDNSDSTIIVNENGECFGCFDTLQHTQAWVPNELMCEGSAEIRKILQECAAPMNACQDNFVDNKPMINNCLLMLMNTSFCNEKLFDCLGDDGEK